MLTVFDSEKDLVTALAKMDAALGFVGFPDLVVTLGHPDQTVVDPEAALVVRAHRNPQVASPVEMEFGEGVPNPVGFVVGWDEPALFVIRVGERPLDRSIVLADVKGAEIDETLRGEHPVDVRGRGWRRGRACTMA